MVLPCNASNIINHSPPYRWSSRTYQQIQALYPTLTHQNSVHIDTYGKNVGKKNTWPEVLINVLLACTTLLHCLNLYFQRFTNLLASFPGFARLSLAVQNLCRRVWSILSRTWSVLHSTEIHWYHRWARSPFSVERGPKGHNDGSRTSSQKSVWKKPGTDLQIYAWNWFAFKPLQPLLAAGR